MATRRICEFLSGNNARFVRLIHLPAYTAQEVAASMHLTGKYMAKVVVVSIDGRLAMAVVPATKTVDLDRLRSETGADDVRLAEKSEFTDLFTECQLGAVPPFGHLFGVETYVDREIAEQEHIVFNAGRHIDAISMTFEDYRRLAHPKLVRIASKLSGAPFSFAAGLRSFHECVRVDVQGSDFAEIIRVDQTGVEAHPGLTSVHPETCESRH